MMETSKIISPVDNSVYAERPLAGDEQAIDILKNAEKTRDIWATLSIAERRVYVQKFLDAFKENKDEIATELTWQMGRPIAYTPFEVDGAIARADYMMSVAEEGLKDLDFGELDGAHRFIKRRPHGVVLIIAPWNYPYLTTINTLIPALMAGNSIILKHSAQTLLCAEQLMKAFKKSGIPEGVFQYIHTSHETVGKMIRDRRVDFVSFTGSVDGGTAMENAAAGRFVNMGLELGGKDPAYVRHDADVEFSAENIADGVFFNSGQSCCGVERVYVHEDVYDPFMDKMIATTEQLILGNPTDVKTTLGPMVRGSAADLVRAQIEEADIMGAQKMIDASKFDMDGGVGSPYLAPQILTNVTADMRVMCEESFGPVVGVIKVSSDEEAIKHMNDCAYGLTASVWTADKDAGYKIAEKIHTGTCFVNRCDYLDPALAWSGVKDSGRGVSLSVLGYQQLTRPKSYYVR